MEFEPYAEQVIKAKAKQLVGRYGFTESDREDIEQELRLRILRRLQDYDPERGSKEALHRLPHRGRGGRHPQAAHCPDA